MEFNEKLKKKEYIYFMPDLLEKYKKYRRRSMKLNTDMIEKCITRNILEKASRYLGILKGNTLIFEYEDEVNVLMDFALHEIKINGKNVIEIYMEKYGFKDEIEKEIINAHLFSYTSLFEVADIFENEGIILLKDLLNKEKKLKLMDIGFSKTASKGLLIFIRILPFEEFNTTSGISFVFENRLKNRLINEYKTFNKPAESESMRCFICFHQLYRQYGIDVYYIHI